MKYRMGENIAAERISNVGVEDKVLLVSVISYDYKDSSVSNGGTNVTL